MIDYKKLKENIMPAVWQAGEAIMEIYHKPESQISIKNDNSPVTQADYIANSILQTQLDALNLDIPVISEENINSHIYPAPNRFFLVDPLDGTREFTKRDGKGHFTVNVALIDRGMPVFGIVMAPALGRFFVGAVGYGAEENGEAISTRTVTDCKKIAVASISYRDAKTDQWLVNNNISQTISIGSSLKFCLIASGEADIYPRFGPTMEWDTAAGHAILAAVGGTVTTPDGQPFTYGKLNYQNGPFIAHADYRI